MLNDQLATESPGGYSVTAAGPAAAAAPLAAQLRAVPGVTGTAVLRVDPKLTIPGRFHDFGVDPFSGKVTAVPADVVSCAQLATVPALGRCPAGAIAAAFPAGASGAYGPLDETDISGITYAGRECPGRTP